jgi:hypothetical protein
MGKIKEIYTETLIESENLSKDELIELLSLKNLKIKALTNLLKDLKTDYNKEKINNFLNSL